MKFNQREKNVHKREAAADPLFWNKYNRRLGGQRGNGECPGHFGQGTGTHCFVCRGRI